MKWDLLIVLCIIVFALSFYLIWKHDEQALRGEDDKDKIEQIITKVDSGRSEFREHDKAIKAEIDSVPTKKEIHKHYAPIYRAIDTLPADSALRLLRSLIDGYPAANLSTGN